MIDKERIELLKFLQAAVDDYALALKIPEFADEYGGLQNFLDKVLSLNEEYEMRYNTESE